MVASDWQETEEIALLAVNLEKLSKDNPCMEQMYAPVRGGGGTILLKGLVVTTGGAAFFASMRDSKSDQSVSNTCRSDWKNYVNRMYTKITHVCSYRDRWNWPGRAQRNPLRHHLPHHLSIKNMYVFKNNKKDLKYRKSSISNENDQQKSFRSRAGLAVAVSIPNLGTI